MRSRVASTKCTDLRHPLFFCGRSNPNGKLITSSRLLLAISPTAILPLKPRWEGSLRTTPLFELEPVTTIPCLNPLSWNHLRICTLSVPFLSSSMHWTRVGMPLVEMAYTHFLLKPSLNSHQISACSSPRDLSMTSSLHSSETGQPASKSNT